MTWSNERHEEARARCDRASVGPWEVPHSCDVGVDEVHAPNAENLFVPVATVRSPIQNAFFIAHAREDFPAALDEIERLRSLVNDPEVIARAAQAMIDASPDVGYVTEVEYEWYLRDARVGLRAAINPSEVGEG